MILTLLLILGLIFICFSAVLAFGAPYLPTLKPQVAVAFQLANLKPGQTLLELGCGDGRVLIAAAKLGVNSIGYELNPLLALAAWARTRRYRSNVRVIWGNYWHKKWPPSDCIFTFLLERYMPKLDNMINAYPTKPVVLISFAFKVPKKDVAGTKDGVFLYRYK